MNSQVLIDIAKQLVAGDKGLLAMDESTPTCNKRFAALGIPQTVDVRRAYRELLVTTPSLGDAISGAILYDESIRQTTKAGVPFVSILIDARIIPGIKVDTGAKELAGHPGEKVTEGLDGLRERLAEYAQIGARFAKWRAVIAIGDGIPSDACIDANAHALARYAALCQEAGMVPIVEPEVVMDGDHMIERCSEVTMEVLRSVFHQLHVQGVMLEGMILKPNMVLSGLQCPTQVTPDQAAEATVKCLLATVPSTVPGIAFLSGGQPAELATDRLRAMNKWYRTTAPWALSFSFARAIQQPALDIWNGDEANVIAAQNELYRRACCNRDARHVAPSPFDTRTQMQPVGVSVEPTQVFDVDGGRIGTYWRRVHTRDGEMMLVTRDERLGGGTIVMAERQSGAPGDPWNLPYGELSIREAPQYSPNVPLHAYFEFWERLGASNANISIVEYSPTGGGPVHCELDVPDDILRGEVGEALRENPDGAVNSHLITVSVNHGTVALEGTQNDTLGRYSAAKTAASVSGVKEIVNMLVVRAN